MKFIPFRFLLFLSSVVLLSSCLSTTNTPIVVSSDASFVSLTYVAKNKIPTVTTTAFTLGDNNTIVNLDSLPYKASIDSVSPTFRFATSAYSVLHFGGGYKKDTLLANGTDTIDFRQLIRIRNVATDGKTFIDYPIKVNVHQVDPEKYVWSLAHSNLNSINATSQKTVTLNDMLFYYSNDGTNAYLYTSADGYTWNQSTVKGLPANTPLNDMMQFNGKLYLTQDGSNIYSSSDGFNWAKKTVGAYTFNSLLYELNGQLWAVVQSNGVNYFAISNDGNFSDKDITKGIIPINFPVKDFASVTFNSPTGKQKVLVVGGHTTTGAALLNYWSSEDGVYWLDFSNEHNRTLDTLAVGASVIPYDNKLLIFGTRNDNGLNFYKVSRDEGLSWQKPDTLRNFLPKDFVPRNFLSAIVYKPLALKGVQTPDKRDQILQSNRIFLIGGKSGSTVFSDVWTGKLNRKNFLRQ